MTRRRAGEREARAGRQARGGAKGKDVPTAVYFDRMWAIMMTHMIRATMWTKQTPAACQAV
jgi:hypothetical protein